MKHKRLKANERSGFFYARHCGQPKKERDLILRWLARQLSARGQTEKWMLSRGRVLREAEIERFQIKLRTLFELTNN